MSNDLQVFGEDGALHDLAWLQANYGSGIKLHEYANPEKGYFKLTAVVVTTSGDISIRICVANASGGAKLGQPVTYSYPELDNPSGDLAAIGDSVVSKWSSRGVLNKNMVDGRGYVEFQVGGDSWIKGAKGPYSAWVLSPSIGSDCLSGIGWKVNTNHVGPMELHFTEVLPGSVVTPPVVTPPVVVPPGLGDNPGCIGKLISILKILGG